MGVTRMVEITETVTLDYGAGYDRGSWFLDAVEQEVTLFRVRKVTRVHPSGDTERTWEVLVQHEDGLDDCAWSDVPENVQDDIRDDAEG